MRSVSNTWQSARPVTRVAALVLAAVVVLLPAIVTAVAIVRPQWYPTGDMAQAELHVRGFWSHPPLVGAAGRIQNAAGVQGSHPGPLLWLAMWPLYALFGSTSTSLVASVVTVHVVTMSLILWLGVRRGGAWFGTSLAIVLALTVHAGGPEPFTEPWNPWMGLLPFVVLLLAVWSVLDGERWMVVLAVIAGSYCVQAHAGYLLITLALLGLAVAWVGVREWRRRRLRPLAGWLAVVTVTGFVLWIPPLLDQVRRDPGNLSILRDSFSHPDAPYLQLSQVAEIVVTQFNVVGPWVLGPGREGIDALTVVGFAGFVALWGAAVFAARSRGAASELRLHAVLAVAALVAVVSISRIFGLYLEYTVRWVWLITALVVAASVVSLARSRPIKIAHRRSVVVGAAALAAIGVVGASAQFASRAGPTGAIDSRIVAGLIPAIEGQLDPDARYLVRWWDPSTLGATGFGSLLELERRGFEVGVDRHFAAAALPHRAMPEETVAAVLYVVSGEVAIERARATPGLVELGSFDVRTDAQQARSVEVRAQLERALSAAGHADRIAWLDRANGQAQLLFANPPLPADVGGLLDEYVGLRMPTAVFEAPPFAVVELGGD